MAKIDLTDGEKQRLQLLSKITQLSEEKATIRSQIVRLETDLRRLNEQLSGKEAAMEEAGAELSKALDVTIEIK